MKIRIIITTSAGELDRQTIDVPDDDDDFAIGAAIVSALETWTLAPGDTIKIVEVAQ